MDYLAINLSWVWIAFMHYKVALEADRDGYNAHGSIMTPAILAMNVLWLMTSCTVKRNAHH